MGRTIIRDLTQHQHRAHGPRHDPAATISPHGHVVDAQGARAALAVTPSCDGARRVRGAVLRVRALLDHVRGEQPDKPGVVLPHTTPVSRYGMLCLGCSMIPLPYPSPTSRAGLSLIISTSYLLPRFSPIYDLIPLSTTYP